MTNDIIYGWSWKNNYDQYIKIFDDEAEAINWLNTEEYDYRERELLYDLDDVRRIMDDVDYDEFLDWLSCYDFDAKYQFELID